jgi:uncharacterized protein YjbI with pentapeptide repeats
MTNDQISYLHTLRSLLDKNFNLSELQQLCFDLEVEYEHLAGDTRPFKINALVLYLARRGKLEDLTSLARKERGKVDWPDVPDPEQQKEDAKTTRSALSQKSLRNDHFQIASNWDGKTKMREFDLSGRNLSRLDLAGADLTGAKLRGTDLYESDLSRAALNGADLHRANLWKADFSEVQLLDGLDLFHADLSAAILFKAKIFVANLHGAHLQGADLREAEVVADISRADLSAADLQGADLRGAQKLWEVYLLSGAKYDLSTKWPEGFDPAEYGANLQTT